MTVDELVQAFALHVSEADAAMEASRRLLMRKHDRKWHAVWEHLRSKYGDEGRSHLMVLLKDERRPVRIQAAVLLLRYCTKEAKSILTKESKRGGLLAFQAEQTLRNWGSGDWVADP